MSLADPVAYDDGSATETLSYQYDAGGRRTRSESADVIQTFTHTRRGQILTADQEIGGSTRHTAYTYTLDGALDTITYPSGRVLTSTPDFAGRPTVVTATPPGGGTPVTVLADAAYLPQGPAETLQLGPPAGRVTETLTHDWQYRRTAQSVVGPGASTLLDLAYAYDPAGNLTALTDNAGTRTAAYAYDDLGRLTGVAWSDGTRSWEYDAIGNVTRLSVDTGLPGEGQVDYAYDVNPSGNNTPELSTLSATSGGSPLWTSTLNTDPAGNITTDGASTYTYNLRNLLGARQLPAATSQHTFDASGRRVETVRSDTGTTTELILGPAGQRLAKQENSVWRDYVWLGDRLIAYFDQGTTDPVIVMSNHIGMPLLATDGAGAPVWEAKAEPYGQLRGTVDKIHDPGLRYPGQWQDNLDLEATCVGDDCTLPGPLEQSFSLFENGYRCYRPDWGRYTQADPLGEGQLRAGINAFRVVGQSANGLEVDSTVFSYANGNPSRFDDALGLFTLDTSCDSCKWGGLGLLQKGIDLARRMIPCLARSDVRGWLENHNQGSGLTILCDDAYSPCRQGFVSGGSPSYGGGDRFWVCQETLMKQDVRQVGITVLHEWLHKIPSYDLGYAITDTKYEAEKIAQQAYRFLMKGACGGR